MRRLSLSLSLSLLFLQGCPTPYEMRHENQWDARDQIWLSEQSQVKLRAAQSRVFETTDRPRLLRAIIDTMQDLDFKVEVLDEQLGIVSGKKFVENEEVYGIDPSYLLYQPDTLLFLTRNYRSWGPFHHRNNLVRFTVTVRPRGDTQLVVRASAQFYLRAVEDPLPYQRFFRTLEQALFLKSITVEEGFSFP
ncbi:hypothetical protein [Nitrospira moscoviensis]|uniref:Uncharacterized protein n=1 Tax=Nitrospira moscoviensis TaxID=42253 RepID=A0A0K2GCH7_NITMO|nr:hypothetical protein [Nitrospira moscoviensis]ALA58302.1 conserved exported protein of unknown function [Nitrospira moscoviensis]